MSFFHKLYKYRQSELRNQKENFLTEIFSYSLRTDKPFLERFLKELNYLNKVNQVEVITQLSDKSEGRPDISMVINNNCLILIECKIDSVQEKTQLNRYSSILLSRGFDNKILVYLTKNFEEVEEVDCKISFHHLRWYQIYNLIDQTNNLITIELGEFLKTEKMSRKVSFQQSEVNAIKNISEIISKMDDLLSNIKDIMHRYIRVKIKYDKNILNLSYGVMADFNGGSIWIGLYEYSNNEETQLCISVDELPINCTNFSAIKEHLDSLNWDSYLSSQEDTITWYNNKSLSEFFEDGSFVSMKAFDFVEKELQKLSPIL